MGEENNIGDHYHLETRYYRDQMSGRRLRREEMPETYKAYPGSETVSLTVPTHSAGEPIWDVLFRRRSIRDYTNDPVSTEELSQLLWALVL